MLSAICSILFLSILVKADPQESADITKNIGKCCGKGEIISASQNFSCVPQDLSTELHHVPNDADNWMHFDECPDSGEVSIRKLSDINNAKMEGTSSACLDLFDGDETLGTIPVVVHCKEPTNIESLRVPKFAEFRTCCPRGLVYDPRSRDCLPKESMNSFDIADSIFNTTRESNIEFASFSRGPPQCKHAIVDYVIDRRDLRVLWNGTLEVSFPPNNERTVTLSAENSCLDGPTPAGLILRLCTGADYCRKNACVRKCCAEGQVRIGKVCQAIAQSSVLPGEFHRELKEFARAESNHTTWKPLDTDNYGLLIGEQTCKYGKYPLMADELPVIDSHGHIHSHLPHERFRHHEYCVEIFHNVSSYDDGFYAAVCFTIPEPQLPNKWRFGINAALELTSCMFLLITFLVYVFLPLLRNLHGKTLMCHVASLFAAYGCLAAIALTTPPDPAADTSSDTNDNNEISSGGGCKFLGYTTLFSFLAAFSWLNVMCFDIWWTFGGLGRAAHGGRKGAQRKRFFLYSFYAWGLAFILVGLAVAVDYTSVVAKHLRPNIGVDSCWFNSESSGAVIFFITPISLQLVANVIFFILTSVHCSRVRAEITRVMRPAADPQSRRFRSDRSKLIVNIKLFIVMGISWIMEIISACLDRYATGLNWRAEFFYVSDAVNCLQGLLIFILFVLKSKVYHALRHRLKGNNVNRQGRMNTALQDPFRVQKSPSCSTLMSTFAVNNNP